MTEQIIDIDRSAEIVTELAARVRKGDAGKPLLEPMPGTAGRWYAGLGRHVDKGPLVVAISRVSQRRSLAQNRLLWAVYVQILDQLRERAFEVGERCPFPNKDKLHQAFKYRFLGHEVTKVLGDEMETESTTTLLTIEQFSAYVKAITDWCALKGIYVELQESA